MEPKWLQIARKEIGVKEIPGSASNPRILEYFKATKYHPDFEDSWCSAFVNFCMQQAGEKRTESAAARSWLKWGVEIKEPKIGCVCVFWRNSPNAVTGHVGLYISEDSDNVLLLGGNQFNSVCIKQYPKERLLAYRWKE
jgi:uncharacterized protein (TIGR02594 family)